MNRHDESTYALAYAIIFTLLLAIIVGSIARYRTPTPLENTGPSVSDTPAPAPTPQPNNGYEGKG